MKAKHLTICVILGVVPLPAATAGVVLETRNLRLEISDDGRLKSLTAKPSGQEYAVEQPGPFAMVYRGGEPCADYRVILADTSHEIGFATEEAPEYQGGHSYAASHVAMRGSRLTIQFGKGNVTAEYEVTATPDYLAFRLGKTKGSPVDRIDLVRLAVARPRYLGTWINVAYDDRFGVCLCAGNDMTNAGMNVHPDHVVMTAIADREVALEGTTAVLFGFAYDSGESFLDPNNKFLDAMEIVERDFNMPSGAKRRRLPVQRYGYLFWDQEPADGTGLDEELDRQIDMVRESGLRILMVSHFQFSGGPGHYPFKKSYPNGMADLKRVVERIRAAGLSPGLHVHYCKTTKSDPYVTPVPDPRLHLLRPFTLSAAIDQKADSIEVTENPQGCTKDRERSVLKIGEELISYEGYSPQSPYRFTGCRRGHLGTQAASHEPAEPLGLLDVDDFNVFIRYDQSTDIQQETAQRVAEIYNRAGPFDMVYFDGAEDVQFPYWYHVGNAQYLCYRLFQSEPPACEAAVTTHWSWHMNTRSNAYDATSSDQETKDFCHRVMCRMAPSRAVNFTRVNFGWLYGWGFSPDVYEYLCSRAAGWDCPVSVYNVTPKAAEVRCTQTADVWQLMRAWEEAKLFGSLSDADRRMLRTLDPQTARFISCRIQEQAFSGVGREAGLSDEQRKQLLSPDPEHHLIVHSDAKREVVPYRQVSTAGAGAFRVFVFQRPAERDNTYALIWACEGAGARQLFLPMKSERLTVLRPFDEPLAVKVDNDKPIVALGGRVYLRFSGMSPEDVGRILERAVTE